jgi:hypothetical protein
MTVRDYKVFGFESACYRTPEYVAFEKQCRKELRAQCKKFGFNLHKFNPNHFAWSAVLEKNGEYVYVSLSDVRFWKWYDEVLIRTMKHAEDWHGDINNRCSFNEIGKTADNLLAWKLRRKAM